MRVQFGNPTRSPGGETTLTTAVELLWSGRGKVFYWISFTKITYTELLSPLPLSSISSPNFESLFPTKGEDLVSRISRKFLKLMWRAKDRQLRFFPDLVSHFSVRGPENMFCFCFQTPSLKLQALDARPSSDSLEPPAQDDTPARQQPFPSEGHHLNQTLPLSPSQHRHTVDSSQESKTEPVKWYWCSGRLQMNCLDFQGQMYCHSEINVNSVENKNTF